MKQVDLKKHMEKGEILPVYYLYGDETYLIEEAVRFIGNRLVPPGLKSFNYDLFYGGVDAAVEIIHASQTMPVMCQKRVVVVKDANRLSAKDVEEIISYVLNPSPFACLIFVGEKTPAKRKFTAHLEKCGALFQLNHPREKEMDYWIQRLAARFDKKISTEGVAFLKEVVGNDLRHIYNELEKGSLYAGDKETIESEDIKAVITQLKVENVFDLVNSIGYKNLEKALHVLQKLLASGEEHLMILGMIVRQIRLLLRGKAMLERGMAPSVIGEKLGVQRFFLKGLFEQTDQFSCAELKEIFDRLLHTDVALKTRRIAKKDLVMEKLIIELCGC